MLDLGLYSFLFRILKLDLKTWVLYKVSYFANLIIYFSCLLRRVLERAWDFFFGVESGEERGDFDWKFIRPFLPFLCFNDLQIGGPFYTSWYLKLYLKLDFELGINKGSG